MTGFEPRITGVGSNRATNCATTTAQVNVNVLNLFRTMLVLGPILKRKFPMLIFATLVWSALIGCSNFSNQS